MPSGRNVLLSRPRMDDVQRVLALGITALLFAAICIILRSRGVKVVLLACCFVASLVSTQLAMKKLASPPFSYKFAGFVTCGHFASVSIVCIIYWACWMGEPHRLWPTSMGSWTRFCRMVVPIALSQPVSVIFNNKAMIYVGAGVVAIIGTLSPVVTAVLSRACGRKLSLVSWLGVLVAFGGGCVISWSEITQVGSLGNSGGEKGAVITGLVFAFLSVFGRSVKIVLMDNLLSPKAYAGGMEPELEEEPLLPLHLFALQFPLSTVISIAYSAATEDMRRAWDHLTPAIVGVIFITCASALALNFIGLQVLKEFGASAQQIIGKLNTICIASISVAFMGEHLPMLVMLGSGLVLGGVAIFERGTAHGADNYDSGSSDGSDEGSDWESDVDDSTKTRTMSEARRLGA